MSSRIRHFLIAAVVVAATYTAAAGLIGIGVQAELQKSEQQMLDSTSYVVLISRDYRRGIYGATEEVTYGLAGPIVQVLRGLPGAAPALTAARLTVHNTIYHGPLPRLRTVAFATVDSQLLLPPRLQSEVSAVLHGQAVLQMHATMGWLGGGRALLTSPAFRYRSAGSLVDWRGIAGTVQMGRGMNSWAATLTAPGLSVQTPLAGVELTDLRLSADMRRAFEALYIGKSALNFQQIAIRPSSGSSIELHGVSLGQASSVDAQYVDQSAELSADSIQAAHFSATRVAYTQSLGHMYGPSLAALVQALRQVQRTGAAAGRGAMLDALRQYGVEVALHAPVLEISRVGFVMPEGELRLSAKFAIPGLARADMQGSAAMAAIAQHLVASADLRVDSALADKLVDSSGDRRAAFATQMQLLQQQGFLTRDGNAYICHVVYQAGRLSVNGQPYPPATAAKPPTG